MTQTYHFQTVKHIVHGAGSLALLPEKLALLDVPVARIALITQPVMEQNGVIGRVVEALAARGVEARIVRGVEPEPTIENVETVFREQIVPFAPDAILSIGGGSVLDAAKLFAVRLTNDQPLREWLGIDLIQHPGIPLILVPTTAGTGSEVTPNAIVTLPDEELKVGIVSRHLLPQLVILDAELTFELPKPITAATGIDAFVHSLESYISTKANPVSDMFAMESMRLIGANIVEAYQNGRSVKARGDDAGLDVRWPGADRRRHCGCARAGVSAGRHVRHHARGGQRDAAAARDGLQQGRHRGTPGDRRTRARHQPA
jgi:alcohol dehydrogenase class IV